MLRLFIGVVFLGVLIWSINFANDAGVFREIEPKSPGQCRVIQAEGLIGAEDITIDQVKGIAYISSYDRRAAQAGKKITGALWTYDLNAADAKPVPITNNWGKAILPHGISFLRLPNGQERLFVIDHANRPEQELVHILDISEGQATVLKTITGPELRSPNDLVAVGENSFYFSNDHRFVSGLPRRIEDYLGLSLTDVYYFDGENFSLAVSDMSGANGINVSEDGAELYLASARGSKIYVYHRDSDTGKLTEQSVLSMPGFPDNIERLPSGDLLIGVHSKAFALLAHGADPTKQAPSHVVKVSMNEKTPETLLYDKGDQLSGASVAAQYGNRLLAGGIFDDKFLDCKFSN